ncbi:MAG: 3'-5' exonuclease [Nanobdellota archaeon]
MDTTPLIVLDIETTGLSPYKHQITEIAAQKILNGVVLEEFHELINPQVPIPRFITRLTGITDDIVRDKPTIDAVLPSLKEFLKDHPIVAHNASFDMKFLQHNFFIHTNIRLDNPALCTAKLARRILHHLPSKKLGAVCEYYNVKNEQAHRALSDVSATVQILNNMTTMLYQYNIKTFNQINQFQTIPIRKAQQLLNNKRNI